MNDGEVYEPPDPAHVSEGELCEPAELGQMSEGEIYEYGPQISNDISTRMEDDTRALPKDNDSSKDTEADNHNIVGGSLQANPLAENPDPMEVDHDAHNGMQLTDPNVINKPQVVASSQPTHSNGEIDSIPVSPLRSSPVPQPAGQTGSHFTPYLTARRHFRNFRYDEAFDEMVNDGHKSITYNNKINPKTPFCTAELVNGRCNDPRCQLQHFGQVTMNGACERFLSVVSLSSRVPVLFYLLLLLPLSSRYADHDSDL
jgi:Putative zinc-finger domain